MPKGEPESVLLYTFNEETTIWSDSCNYVVHYSKNKRNPAYFGSLDQALYDIYLERIRIKLREEQCKELDGVVKKIEDCNEEMRTFIKNNIKTDKNVGKK